MNKQTYKNKLHNSLYKQIILICSILISLLLGAAAFGKIFFPAELIQPFDRTVGALECVLLITLLFLRYTPWIWLTAACIFAAWGGYALFWYFLELPCSCMGTKLNIPTCYAILLDVLFCFASFTFAKWLGAKKAWIVFCIFVCVCTATIGYIAAGWIYKNWIVRL